MPRSCHICGGPVDPQSPSYVVRPEEWEIRQYLDNGCYVTIMGPRQIGKSTLLWGIKSRRRNDPDCRFAYLDLSELAGLEQSEWYGHLSERIAQGFGLPAQWLESIHKPANHLGFERFLSETAPATKAQGRLYVLFDEVDSVPAKFSEMFFRTLRAIYHYSKIGNNPHFARYVFVFAGAFKPADLIRDPTTSPFNISRQVYPENFQGSAVRQLVDLIPQTSERWRELASDAIYDWTHGHPYLTQRLCTLLDADADAPHAEVADKVAQLAESLINSNDSNLEHVRKALVLLRGEHPQLYEWVQRLAATEHHMPVDAYLNGPVSKLRLMGLVVRNEKGFCTIANRLYRLLLDHARKDQSATPIQPSNDTTRIEQVDECFEAPLKRAEPAEMENYLAHATGDRRRELHSPLTQDEHPTQMAPSKIGRYLVRSLLGQGGFGTVYLGHDPQMDRPVAIKVPSPELLESDQARSSFLREARSVARLRHQNIVTVHDFGQESNGLCFLVYEFIEGTNLAAQLARNRLARDEAMILVAQIAEALHCAHLAGLVHRDIKPGNILLDLKGRPYVADFGLAIREHELPAQRGRLSGTPAYMSPEQVRREGHHLDARTDIYSLGVVFYELLCGRRPFYAETTDELFDQIKHREARPPRTIDDSIPRDLEHICLKAMSKRIVERYTTAKDMAEELRQAVAQHAIGS